jgi:hypothetical protein
MRHANRPSGPSKPIAERRDAVAEREGRDELEVTGRVQSTGGAQASDPARNARQAERAAHTRSERERPGASSGPARRRPR